MLALAKTTVPNKLTSSIACAHATRACTNGSNVVRATHSNLTRAFQVHARSKLGIGSSRRDCGSGSADYKGGKGKSECFDPHHDTLYSTIYFS